MKIVTAVGKVTAIRVMKTKSMNVVAVIVIVIEAAMKSAYIIVVAKKTVVGIMGVIHVAIPVLEV
jgi:hypothetical protein